MIVALAVGAALIAVGFTCEDAAARFGCPLGTVLSSLHRARARLQEAMAEPA